MTQNYINNQKEIIYRRYLQVYNSLSGKDRDIMSKAIELHDRLQEELEDIIENTIYYEEDIDFDELFLFNLFTHKNSKELTIDKINYISMGL